MKAKTRYFAALFTLLMLPVAAWADVNVSTFAELQTALSGNEAVINVTADITVTSQLTISRNITINGNGHTLSVSTPYLNEDGTRASSASSGGVFTISSGSTVTLTNMTVMGGTCTDTSAAINNYGTLTLNHVTMIRCNRGLYNYGSGAVAVLTNCVLIRNSAAYGGGLLNEAGQLLMDCCSFSENCSTNSGGGAAENKSGGIMYLNNVTMSNNFCSEKGALNNYAANADNQSTMYVMNSTITGNVTRDQYGAIARNGTNGKVNVVNSIITDNYYSNGGAWGQNDVTDGNYAYCVVEHYSGGGLENCKRTSSDNVFQGYTDSGIYTTVGTTNAFNHTTLVSTESGQYVAPVSPDGPAASGGTKTYFEYTIDTSTTPPTLAVSMSYEDNGVNTSLGGLPISNNPVTKNQDGSDRVMEGDIPIGSAKVSSADAVYYTVRLGNGISHGGVTGATYYGDTYESGTSVTVTAIPDNGYVLQSWTVNDVENFSTNNPYTFTLNSNVTLVPVFLKDINDTHITITVEYATYTGSAITPVVTVKDGSTTLTSADYTISYKGSTLVDAKTYVEEIIITGKGNYSGTRYADFTISPKNINLCSVEGNSTPYTSNIINPSANIMVKDGSTTLSSPEQYTLSVSGAYTYKEPGIYANAITIEGKGNYTGTKYVNFIIAAADAKNLTDGKLLVTSSAVYTGARQEPSTSSITILYDGTALGTGDYEMTFAPDAYINAQTYSGAITITANSASYYGSITTDYVIAPRNMNEVTAAKVKEMSWTGNAIIPVVNGNDETNIINLYYADYYLKSSDPVDYTYTVSPSPVKEPDTYTFTFEGRGNFIGTTQLEVLVQKDINHASVAVDIDKVILPDGTTWNTTWTALPLVVNDGTKTLTIGTDYDLEVYTDVGLSSSVSSITGDGIYYAKFIGKNNYKGTKSKKFYVLKEYYGRTELNISADLHLTEVVSSSEIHAKLGNADGTAVIDDATTVYQNTARPRIIFGSDPPIVLTLIGIEDGAFANCTSLTGIEIRQRYITEVANGAFAGCTALRYVDLSEATGFVPTSLQRNIVASPFYGVPKQTLIYLNGTRIKGENYIYQVDVDDYRCDVFKIFDDLSGSQTSFAEPNDYRWAYENLHAFTANSVVNTRKLTAGQHYTTCLPYPLAISEGMKAYQLSASSSQLLSFEEVTTGTLSAFTPYVLIPSASGQLLSTTAINVPATTGIADFYNVGASAVTAVGGHRLVGSLRYMGTGADNCFIMQSNNTWKAFTGAGGYPGACILPMRAYIMTTNYPSASREFLSANFTNADGSTTAIDGLMFDQEETTVYDLQGRKVRLPQRQGIYIKDGHKLVKK